MAKRKSEQSGHERAVSAVSNERLNRYIARSGVTSRRKADDLISAGRVSVNGTVVTELGTRISKGDVVEVNGRRISPRDHHYILLNKPNDVVCRSDGSLFFTDPDKRVPYAQREIPGSSPFPS